MAANLFDQFDAAPVAAKVPVAPIVDKAPAATSSNPFDQFDAPQRQNVGTEAPRRSYTAGEVPAAALKNLPKSAGKFVGGIYEAVTSPIQTAKGLIDVGAGAIQNVLPQGVVDFVNSFSSDPSNAERAVTAANAVGGMFKDRYGDYDKIKRTLAEDPVGAAADLSTLFSGGALATTKVPAVSTALTKAATVTNPLSVVTKPVEMYAKSKNALLQTQKEANVVRDANLLAAQKEGYVVTPSSLDPTGANIVKERIAGKTHLEQLASIKNQTITDNLARKAVGLPENAQLTPEVMKGIREAEYTKGYAPLKKLGEIAADDAYITDLANIEAKYTGASKSFPGVVPDEVGKLIKGFLVDKFDSGDVVDVVRNLREQASANFRKGENAAAKAQLDVATALEGQIARVLETSGDPNLVGLLEQFRASRQRMAVSHTVEEAIRKGSGSVDGRKLARDIQNDKFMTGDLKTAAEFANTFPRVNVPPSMIGTPGAGTILGRSLSGAAGAGAGFAAGGGLGAVVGAAAPELISAGMREYMLSRVGQKGAVPKYNKYQDLAAGLTDEGLRNALLATQAGDISRENKNKLAR
jgi:hypothetical protein